MNRCSRISLSLSIPAALIACAENSAYPGITEPNTVSYAKGANNLNAKSCQKEGWTRLYASTWQAFVGERACTSHGAEGGSYLMIELSNGRLSEGQFLVDVTTAGFPRNTLWLGEFGGTTTEMLFDGDGRHTFAVDCPSRYPTVYLTATSPDGLATITTNALRVDCPP